MKKTFVFLFLFLSACSDRLYTVQNNSEDPIVINDNDEILAPGQCGELIDLPIIGDFPIKFRDQSRHLFSEKSFPPGHYVISPKGEILEVEEACNKELLREPALENSPETPEEQTSPSLSPESPSEDSKSPETSDGDSSPADSKTSPPQEEDADVWL